MNNYRSTTSTPLWLLALTAVLIGIRVLLAYADVGAARPVINWHVVKTGLEDKSWRDLKKPRLYYFTADWWPACQNFEQVTLSNRRVAKFINDHFVAVKVVDNRGVSSSPSHAVQHLRKRFNILVLPSLVITNAQGRRVSVKENDANSLAVYQFLCDSYRNYDKGVYLDANSIDKSESNTFPRLPSTPDLRKGF